MAAALAARRKGFKVMVADGAEPPLDKACGEGLMPDGVEAIRRLGVPLDSADGFPFRGLRFLAPGISVEATLARGRGIGLRRIALHRLLLNAAAAAGVEFLWRTPATALLRGGVCFGNRFVRARWTVGADGAGSRMRRWAGLGRKRFGSRRFGFRRHFRIGPWTDCVEVYWGAGCQLYVTPVSAREVCVALISRRAGLRLAEALPKFPELRARLEDAEPTSAERGAVSATFRLRRVCRGPVALVGDASGALDAISGEGLGLCFHQAHALASALEADDLSLYQREHRRLARRPMLMTALMLAMDRWAGWRDRALRALALNPAAFARLLSMHVGASSGPEFVRKALLPLASEMLWSSSR